MNLFFTLSLLLALGVDAGPVSKLKSSKAPTTKSSSSSCWSTLSYDNFDGSTGTFSGLPTTIPAPPAVRASLIPLQSNYIFAGTGNMGMRNTIDDVQQDFQNLSGQTDVRVSFSYLPDGFDSGEGFGFRLCVNGDYSSCTPDKTFIVGNDFDLDVVVDVEEIFDISDISSYPTSVALVFFNSASVNDDRVFIDNVKLEAKGTSEFCSSIKSTKAPSVKATGCSLKSTKSPSSTKAPSLKSTKAPSSGSGSMIITYDNFDVTSGFGNWISGGSSAFYLFSQNAIEISGGVDEVQMQITHFNEQDISMFSAVSVDFTYELDGWETDDSFELQYSIDGGEFTTAATFTNLDDIDDANASVSITDGIACASTIKLRFQNLGNFSTDEFILKNVLVSGTS